MSPLPENLVLKVVSEIHDPVTTTDELIPSGETSSFRSNPLGLAEFALSRKDPEYVGRAKEVQKAQKAVEADTCPGDALPEIHPVMDTIRATFSDVNRSNVGFGSTIFAVKPGDGSARELINWGMIPFVIDQGELPFHNLDYLFVPKIREAIADGKTEFEAYVVKDGALKPFTLRMGELTPDEKDIILKGCLINYYRG